MVKNIKNICDDINDLQFNDIKNNIIFKFVIRNKIRYNKQNNKILFDLNQLNENQLNDLNNLLIN